MGRRPLNVARVLGPYAEDGGRRWRVVTIDANGERKNHSFASEEQAVEFHGGEARTMPCGWFYAIQLLPREYPRRIKFGFSLAVEAHLKGHKTCNPGAVLLAKWRCSSADERDAIKFIGSACGHCVSREVYDCRDWRAVVSAGDRFFSEREKALCASLPPAK